MKLMRMVIPKTFKIDNYRIELKDRIDGDLYIDKKESYFKGNNHKIIIKLNNDMSYDSIYLSDIKNCILDIYLKGIHDGNSLNKDELSIFYFITNVKDLDNMKNDMIFIGYEHNYISTIKNVLSQICKCDSINLSKNLELYHDDEYKNIYNTLIRKTDKYSKIVIDITNVYLLKDKYNTKNLIDYLLSKHKKILLIVNGYRSKFLEIYGSEYEDKIIDRDYIIYSGFDQVTINRIKKVLF